MDVIQSLERIATFTLKFDNLCIPLFNSLTKLC